MCCGTGRHHGFQNRGQQSVCLCGCDDPAFFRPRFITQKQQIARLEKHLEDLQEEAKAVEEYLDHIKKDK